ncbi:MAG TPA: 50S ribosomal protein L13 [Candidatus Aenigmarchaeota archaeon]|nr:50S ribosomal protein L13 [Candidatus Aenigmarchaeota archaeon]
MIIDAENQVLGRLASKTAKELLKGKRVIIVNAEKAVISGSPDSIFNNFLEKIQRGDPYHGPFYPRKPDKILRRVIRGMLPKKPRGREALKRLRVCISVPKEISERDIKKFAESENKLKCKHITLGKLSERLGAKKTW